MFNNFIITSMKRFSFLVALLLFIATVYSQSWVSNSNFNQLYTSSDSTKVGIGISDPSARLHVNNGVLKVGDSYYPEDRAINMIKIGDGDYVRIGEWEADDELSFKATKYNFTKGNVGIGTPNPLYKLDISGKLYLRTYDTYDGWSRSFLLWPAHKLILGTPENNYAHTLVEIIPGGSSEGEVFSALSLYHAYSTTDKVERIHFTSNDKCWINTPANVGIGTDNPLYKLDVRGTIRANEIIVNTVGADFVFEDDYNLRPLQEVKSYVQENHHLPEIPSAQEMQEDGMGVEQMIVKLLQKVEELTLYNIQLEERISELEKK